MTPYIMYKSYGEVTINLINPTLVTYQINDSNCFYMGREGKGNKNGKTGDLEFIWNDYLLIKGTTEDRKELWERVNNWGRQVHGNCNIIICALLCACVTCAYFGEKMQFQLKFQLKKKMDESCLLAFLAFRVLLGGTPGATIPPVIKGSP